MKIYLAARYSRHPEMRQVRDWLEQRGHKVTSRWIDCHGGELPASFAPAVLNADPEGCGQIAQVDVDDVAAADAVISFTSDGGGKGGRHVEHGLALGLGKRVIVCGSREHIFHTLPGVEHYTDWESLQTALTAAGDRTAQGALIRSALAPSRQDHSHALEAADANLAAGYRCPAGSVEDMRRAAHDATRCELGTVSVREMPSTYEVVDRAVDALWAAGYRRVAEDVT